MPAIENTLSFGQQQCPLGDNNLIRSNPKVNGETEKQRRQELGKTEARMVVIYARRQSEVKQSNACRITRRRVVCGCCILVGSTSYWTHTNPNRLVRIQ
jgi:hypothetical protein